MKTYTFYVGAAPEGEVISRTLELPAAWTLEDLHDAIQEAFGLDGQAGFSFYMSGEAWDEASEYTHLDEDDMAGDGLDDNVLAMLNADDDELWPDEDEVDEVEAIDGAPLSHEAALDSQALDADVVTGPLAPLAADEPPQEAVPSAQDIRAMFAELKKNPELRGQIAAQLSDELKMPPFLLDAVLTNAEAFLSMLPDDSLGQMLAQGAAEMTDEDKGPLGDTREVRLEELDLKPEQSFLYLYDYDLERYFDVQVDSVQERDLPETDFPRVLESIGELPPTEEDAAE